LTATNADEDTRRVSGPLGRARTLNEAGLEPEWPPALGVAIVTLASARRGGRPMHIETGFLFDLDGTLVDSVYQHVLAWKSALDAENIELSVWRIHRKIGMSGGLFTNQLLRETGFAMEPERIERLRRAHAAAYQALGRQVRPLPGARDLLGFLTDAGIPWAIATSGRMETAAVNLAALGVDPKASPVVTRDEVRYAKPDPDLFLAAAARLDVPIERTIVVGDSIWDMLAATRCRALGVGLLSGGYGSEELRQSGAIRVYEDPADLLGHIDEVGGRR
jgi:HAD superfamily hydrolase (TIGR01509 family)